MRLYRKNCYNTIDLFSFRNWKFYWYNFEKETFYDFTQANNNDSGFIFHENWENSLINGKWMIAKTVVDRKQKCTYLLNILSNYNVHVLMHLSLTFSIYLYIFTGLNLANHKCALFANFDTSPKIYYLTLHTFFMCLSFTWFYKNIAKHSAPRRKVKGFDKTPFR